MQSSLVSILSRGRNALGRVPESVDSGRPASRQPQPKRSSRPIRGLVGFIVMVLVASAAFPSGADDLSGEIEKLREQQSEVKKQQAERSKKVDVATAEANELAAALAALNAKVNTQEGKLGEAEGKLEQAVTRYTTARQAVVSKSTEIEALESQVSNRAVSAFVEQGVGETPILDHADPNQAIFMQSLVDSVTKGEVDVAERLKEAKEDLAVEEFLADEAAEEADQIRAQMAEQLAEVEETRDEQAVLTDAAEERLEAQLAEAAILAERDQALSAELTKKNEELAKQAAIARAKAEAAAKAAAPAPSSSGKKYPGRDEIVQVRGFWVHVDIANNLENMLAHAARDGVTFGGWGYRDHQAQIRLRKQNCGTSNYAIYQQRSSTCRPPTARPGSSQHELGKAIDFTTGGRTIKSRNTTAFRWLKANAARYGFYNLPSEPWHWSVNGR